MALGGGNTLDFGSIVSSDPDSVEQVHQNLLTGNFIEECLLIQLLISIDKEINIII